MMNPCSHSRWGVVMLSTCKIQVLQEVILITSLHLSIYSERWMKGSMINGGNIKQRFLIQIHDSSQSLFPPFYPKTYLRHSILCMWYSMLCGSTLGPSKALHLGTLQMFIQKNNKIMQVFQKSFTNFWLLRFLKINSYTISYTLVAFFKSHTKWPWNHG
jgi:hypothetical protein